MFPKRKDPAPEPSSKLETITPAQAAAILKLSDGRNFRPMRASAAQAIADAITAGHWSVNGEAIILNGDGACIDGQHRLQGCVLAGKPIVTIVVRGVTDDTYIDSGMSRTVAQVLHQKGYKYAPVVAAVAKYAMIYESGNRTNTVVHIKSDRGAIVSYALQHPELQDSAAAGEPTRKIMRASTMSWVHFEAARRGLKGAVETFIHAIAEGAGLEENNPALLLRNRMLGSRRTVKISQFHSMILAVKAWNAWAAGEPLSRLMVYSGRDGVIELPEFYTEG